MDIEVILFLLTIVNLMAVETASNCGTYYTVHRNTTYHDYWNLGDVIQYSTLMTCQRQCHADSSCRGFKYIPGSRTCQLMSCDDDIYLQPDQIGWNTYVVKAPGACGGNPCLNGGTCSSPPSTTSGTCVTEYTCTCHLEFTGDNCETQIWSDNLVTNFDVATDMSGWTLTANGGNGVQHSSITFSKCHEPGTERNVPNGRLVTSHGWARRFQTIDLTTKGLSTTLLDSSPEVLAYTWIHNHSGYGKWHRFRVRLLDSGGGQLGSLDTGDYQNTAPGWVKKTHTFSSSSYPSGLRTIEVYDGGKDNMGWSGHYGCQIAGVVVLVKLV